MPRKSGANLTGEARVEDLLESLGEAIVPEATENDIDGQVNPVEAVIEAVGEVAEGGSAPDSAGDQPATDEKPETDNPVDGENNADDNGEGAEDDPA